MPKKKPSVKIFLFLVFGMLVMLLLIFYFLDQQKEGKPVTAKKLLKESTDIPAVLERLEKARQQPNFAWPTSNKMDLMEISHSAFSLGYSEEHEQAAWVSYLLSRLHQKNSFERRNNFKEDPLLPTGSASSADYTNSGYDRGHLAPAGDLDFRKEALAESFYMSNVSPQHPSFNRGGWRVLEEQVRLWASREDSLLLVTGPVLQPGLKRIGENKVSIPNYFFKIILDARPPEIKMIGFLMPNRSIRKNLVDYVVPLDSIEEISGLDFFPQMPDILEDSLENSVQQENWF